MQYESVKIKQPFVDMLRDRKKATGIPISTSIESALADAYGDPKPKKKKK
jgi:hypothetical protein